MAGRLGGALLGLDHARYHHWVARAAAGGLDDLPPGGNPLHGLLDWERAAILQLFEAWGDTDRSHRKLAHRGSRIDLVHVSESTVLRVLAEQGLRLPGNPPREPAPAPGWPEWLEWKPNRIWCYDFTHWTRAGLCSIAIIDVVSGKWLTTLTSPEETSTQVEVAFTAALQAEALLDAADARATQALRAALARGDRDKIHALADDGQVPLLLAVFRQRAPDDQPLHPGVPSRHGHRLPVRPPRRAQRPGLDRVPVRPRQERVAAPGEDPRCRHPGSRA
jgi:hypothetical protein